VAGFDVIYACQDIDFDRGQGLKSLPAATDLGRGLVYSRLLHALAFMGFLAVGWLFRLGGVYFAGVAGIGLILALEQVLVARRLANVPLAFFTLNGVVSVLYFVLLCLDRWRAA
jgi:4-hydroxybenzoate polyprenyltransferase